MGKKHWSIGLPEMILAMNVVVILFYAGLSVRHGVVLYAYRFAWCCFILVITCMARMESWYECFYWFPCVVNLKALFTVMRDMKQYRISYGDIYRLSKSSGILLILELVWAVLVITAAVLGTWKLIKEFVWKRKEKTEES